jgi:hypothetical protein
MCALWILIKYQAFVLFAWLTKHQLAVFLSQSKQSPAISQQYFSLRTNQHQPNERSNLNPFHATSIPFSPAVPHMFRAV